MCRLMIGAQLLLSEPNNAGFDKLSQRQEEFGHDGRYKKA